MDHFDPYHKWLGIPPDQQPPSYYRLLGIEELESDPDVIEGSAEQRTIYLRTFQTGPNAIQAERLLNEVSLARICLLNPADKLRYDQQLQPPSQTIESVFSELQLEDDPDSAETPQLQSIPRGPTARTGWGPSNATKPFWQQPWILKTASGAVIATLVFLFIFWGRDHLRPLKNQKESSNSKKVTNPKEVTNSIGIQLTLIPAGHFMMGSSISEPDRYEDETQHAVNISKPFYLAKHEVTQQQYLEVMGRNSSRFWQLSNPAENVSWNEAVEFCRKLSELPKEQTAGRVYRLPSEAEWEYARRAGTTTAYSISGHVSSIGNYAWCDYNSDNTTHPVGQKKANPFGLFDMHGNVWEWCADWYGPYPNGETTDPTGPPFGSHRVSRGGGWDYYARMCRSAYRSADLPSVKEAWIGFRVALSLSEQ